MGLVYLLSFIIWPFGAVVFSFIRYSKKWTKNVIWAFVVFYGYTFVLSNDTMDANRLKERFEFILTNNLNVKDLLLSIYIYNDNTLNFLEPIIMYVISIFTSSFQVMMAVLALIFGYFYSRNICYLIDRAKPNIKLYNYILLWLFIFIIGFWQINAFRFWTSAHIFFYAIIPFLIERNKRRLWWLPIAVLLHYSFLLPTLVFLAYLLIGNRIRVFFYVFCVSFLVGTLNLEQIGDVLMKVLPASFEAKINAKMSTDKAIAEVAKERGMSSIMRKLMFFSINLSYVFYYLYYKAKIKTNSWMLNLFSFSLLMMLTGNLTSLVPRGGGRFLIVASLFSLSFLFLYIQNYPLKQPLKLFLNISAPLFFVASLGYIRYALNTTNIIAILGNPLILAFTNPNKALIEFLPFL